MTLKHKLTAGFGAALCVLAMIGILSYKKFSQENVDQQWVAHTHQVLEQIASILSALLELNADERGFALTHQDAYLQSCQRLDIEINSDLAELSALTADNPKQQSALASLTEPVTARLALTHELGTQLLGSNSFESPRIALTTKIRSILSEMRVEEERLLAKRLQEVESGSRQMKIFLGLGYGFFLVLFTLTVYSIFREIEKRTRSEEGLRRAQEQYRLLFDSNPIPVWVYDLNTLSILDVNATAIKRYGFSRNEFLAMKITDIRPQPDVPALLKNIQESAESIPASGPSQHRTKSGEVIDVQIRSYPLTFAGKHARLVVATDVTEQKRAEDALKESEERFRLIVANIKDYAIIVLDPQGQVMSWNGGAQKIKGYQAEEIVGKHFSVFYPAEDVAIGKPAVELKSAKEEGRFEDEGIRLRKDGSHFWANVVVTPLQDDAGRVRGFVKITRDITEKRKAEQEIVRRSMELEAANKELEAFSYSVSHDLRAPLRGIDGFSQALQEDYAQQLDATANDYLRRIRAATKRMGELIDDLLNLSRVTRSEMYRERVDLSKLAGDIVQELQFQEPARKVAIRIAEGLTADGDTRLLRVALQNLFGNAWKFTSKQEQAQVEFGQQRSNGDKPYFVRDNGAGFQQSYAARLFGAFQRLHAATEFPGTGIGLATVQRIIHRHGGTVWAEGAVNQGATIYFTLERPSSSPKGHDER
jgi:PAS domain S-box-containing protein